LGSLQRGDNVLEDTLLAVLRVHADRLAWADGRWAKVILEDTRRDMQLAPLDSPQSFDSALRVLKSRELYREIDSESGWVDMSELPSEG
jgi:hypothetical protein